VSIKKETIPEVKAAEVVLFRKEETKEAQNLKSEVEKSDVKHVRAKSMIIDLNAKSHLHE